MKQFQSCFFIKDKKQALPKKVKNKGENGHCKISIFKIKGLLSEKNNTHTHEHTHTHTNPGRLMSLKLRSNRRKHISKQNPI